MNIIVVRNARLLEEILIINNSITENIVLQNILIIEIIYRLIVLRISSHLEN